MNKEKRKGQTARGRNIAGLQKVNKEKRKGQPEPGTRQVCIKSKRKKEKDSEPGTRQVCRDPKQIKKKGGISRARNAAGSGNSDKKKSDRRGQALQRETSPRPSLRHKQAQIGRTTCLADKTNHPVKRAESQ